MGQKKKRENKRGKKERKKNGIEGSSSMTG